MSSDNTSNDPKQEVLSDDAAKVEDEIKKTQNSVTVNLAFWVSFLNFRLSSKLEPWID